MVFVLFHSTDRERKARAISAPDVATARKFAAIHRRADETVTAIGTRSQLLPFI